MSRHLPVRFSAFRVADQGQTLEGVISLKEMRRLKDVAGAQSGDATVRLVFGRRVGRHPVVEVEVKTLIAAECQRCGEPFQLALESESELVMVETEEEASALIEGLEPLLVEEGVLDVSTMVEDEILLSVPAIPRHQELAECHPPQHREFDPDEEVLADPERKNPFAVLESLKKH